jgi:hypothetical protein
MVSDSNLEQHQMRLEKTYPSGAEEWYCPTCGRRFIVKWLPEYEKIDLEVGDQYALHSGSKGGLRIGSLQISQEDDAPAVSDELRAALEEALKDVDLDDWASAAGE